MSIENISKILPPDTGIAMTRPKVINISKVIAMAKFPSRLATEKLSKFYLRYIE